MRKLISIPIFFVLMLSCIVTPIQTKTCGAANEECGRTIVIGAGEQEFVFQEREWILAGKLDKTSNPSELLKKVYKMGFSPKECVLYVYENCEESINQVCSKINLEPIDATMDVSTGVPVVSAGRTGRQVVVDSVYEELFWQLASDLNKIELELKTNTITPSITNDSFANLKHEKSNFITYINGSNQEGRIQNIKVALEKLNGVVLQPGQKLSFNEIIGDTTSENGYALAKVILNGKYLDDYGGGVCQAATTLYNAALIAGLEVVKVRPHSLKVGYVAGSFDAMVSAGISDLVIKNNYTTPVYIHAYATDFECGVKIFGARNEYEVKRRTEIVEFNEEELPDVSYKSEGYLDYYKMGELVKTEKIRTDCYKKVRTENV